MNFSYFFNLAIINKKKFKKEHKEFISEEAEVVTFGRQSEWGEEDNLDIIRY